MGNLYQEQAKVFKAFCDPKRLAILEQLHDSGRTVVIITHDDEIAEQAARRVRIKDGRVVLDTKYEEEKQHA